MMKNKCPSKLTKLALISTSVWFLSSILVVKPQSKTTIPVNVGIVLNDLNHSVSGKIWLSSIEMSRSDFYVSHPDYKTRLVLITKEYKQYSALGTGASNAAADLIKDELVQAIIGPLTSMETSIVINIGDEAHVPIISFSATSPSLASLGSSYFFQFAQNDASQVKALSAIIKSFGWNQVVPIYVDSVYDDGIIPFLIDALEEVDARVPYRSAISASATDDQIANELYKLMTMQTRVFIVHMTTNMGSRLFIKAKEIGMMVEGYVWITTSGITNGLQSLNASVIESMQGVIGVRTYVPPTSELEELRNRWKRQFQRDNPAIIGPELDVFALWAYDATYALAMAIEQVSEASSSFGSQKSNDSKNSTEGVTFLTSPYGPELCKALSTSRFKGIAGDFSLVDGQLQSSNLSIVNVNGRGVRSVGFWTPQHGMVDKLNSTSSMANLEPIIWPGGTLSVPIGWVNPVSGEKLKVGILFMNESIEFVKVTNDPVTRRMEITGFSIDVFKAAVELLPYALPYEFIPYAKPDGTSAGDYDDFLYEVYLENFDVVVGDITDTGNKSLYVDFTVPYMEAGVVMVVPVQDIRNKNVWSFLVPWTWDLWATVLGLSLFISFVVWVLEHRVNDDFGGLPSNQIGNSLWFSYSTIVSANTAKVVSNLGRLVMAVWILVVLALTINYTANLSSLYTIQNLKPSDTNLNYLLWKGERVGYIENKHYVYQQLKQAGFNDSKLKSYQTMQEIDEALSRGTASGGVAAVFGESPYMTLFLSEYCNKYTMIGPVFETYGYAFALPRRSSILRDLSFAVLQLTRGEMLGSIKSKWLKIESSCQPLSTPPSVSSSLDSGNFWFLFLIAGVTSTLALIIYTASFIYRHRHVFTQPDGSRVSTWRKIQTLFKIFNEKDPNSHTFRPCQPRDSAVFHSQCRVCMTPSPDHDGHRDINSVFSGEQQTSSPGEASSEIAPVADNVVVPIQAL